VEASDTLFGQAGGNPIGLQNGLQLEPGRKRPFRVLKIVRRSQVAHGTSTAGERLGVKVTAETPYGKTISLCGRGIVGRRADDIHNKEGGGEKARPPPLTARK